MPSIEKRENPRINIEAPATITSFFNKDFVAAGQIWNISVGGIGVKAKTPPSFSGIFREGDEVEFSTTEDRFKFHGAGRVAWTSPPGDKAGIKFTQLTEQNRGVLERLLWLSPSYTKLWKGKVRAEGLEMIASVHVSLPGYNKPGKWYGNGISEKPWGHLPEAKSIETNIGRVKILKQISEPSGLFAVEFKGMGIPTGPLAIEVGIVKDSAGPVPPAGRLSPGI